MDLAPLVGGECLGQLDRRRPPADGLGLEPGRSELAREVVRVLDSRRIDDPGRGIETVAVEARCGLVEDLLVEDLGQDLLVVVAADDRHGGDRGRGAHAERAQGRDQAAPGGVSERQVVHRGREDVRDLLGDQLLRRRHPDEDGLREAADGRARLVPERRVRFVADDELIGAARDRADVAGEPGIRLDGDRVAAQRLPSREDGLVEPVAVSLRREIARELVHEQPPVGEDEDSHRARGLDEPRRGDRLSGGGRMAEAEAADGPGIVGRGRLSVVGFAGELVLELLLVLLDSLGELGAVPIPVSVLELLLVPRDQLGQHPGERVGLVAAQLRARGEPRGSVAEHTLEPEHEGVVHFPLGRGRAASGLHLDQGRVERVAPAAPFREHIGNVFTLVEEGLPRPGFGAEGGCRQGVRFLRPDSRMAYRFLHGSSAVVRCLIQKSVRARTSRQHPHDTGCRRRAGCSDDRPRGD